jgi:hypothetical protein
MYIRMVTDLPMHDFGVASINQCVPGVGKRLGAHLERDHSRQILAVVRQCRYEVARHVVVNAPHIALQFRLSYRKQVIKLYQFVLRYR